MLSPVGVTPGATPVQRVIMRT